MKSNGNVVVFLSGRGSNFLSLYRASQRPSANFRIVAVVSDKPAAAGVARARRLGLPVYVERPRDYPDKSAYERRLIESLRPHAPELICLAGYMRLVGEELLRAFPGRILNIHPALLPAFPGLDAQEQALAYGVKVAGCTVHFVDGGVDSGPIVLQQAVPVREDDTADSLAKRILRREHILYPRAVQLFFAGRLHLQGRRVIIGPE